MLKQNPPNDSSTPQKRSRLFLTRRFTGALLVALSGAFVTVIAAQYPQPDEALPAVPTARIGNPLIYQAFQPCRAVNTAVANGTFGGPILVAGATRNFDLVPGSGSCTDNVPASAKALVINVTVFNTAGDGYLTIFPGGTTRPVVASINFKGVNSLESNEIIVPVGVGDGSINVFSSNGTHMTMEIVGYFFNEFVAGDKLALTGSVAGGAVVEVTNNSTSAASFTAAIRGNADAAGSTTSSAGVIGSTVNAIGVYGRATNASGIGVRGFGTGGAVAGHFSGDVSVSGTLTKGAGSFKIDHPADPANKYLSHSFVESPEMMNVYNGNITTDGNGRAVVTMPEYFSALNADFRYQLTVLGEFAQAMVADEMKGNTFSIKTNKPNVKVSWQVTGVRNDAYAKAHRIPVEEEKKGVEIGAYLHPELFNQPAEKNIEYVRNPALYRLEKGAELVAGSP